MLVRNAKAIAHRWVNEKVRADANFRGAFFHGSINTLPDEAILPVTSDVDVMVVFAEPPSVKLGKFFYQDVLLEVSYLADKEVQSAEEILGQSHLAGSFRTPSIIADPTGRLREIQALVARDFAKRQWVIKRCEHATEKIRRNLRGLAEVKLLHEQALSWLFATGVTTHVLLAAGLRNPTVRKRYVAVKQLLIDYNRTEFHESLLELLGCASMSRARVEQHLAAMSEAFDAAKQVVVTPVFFASDISDVARPIAIDGSRELIEQGLHREAVFWIAVTYARCQQIFYEDAQALYERFAEGFRTLLADLGLTSPDDFRQRSEQIEAFLPRLWQVAEAIVDANPEVSNT